MSAVHPEPVKSDLTLDDLDKLNVAQSTEGNAAALRSMGGTEALARRIGVDLQKGLRTDQVDILRAQYGNNHFPSPPMKSFCQLFIEAFNDVVLWILIAAAVANGGIAVYEGEFPYETVAIGMAILIVALVTAGNDYSKELQFRKLEESARSDETCTVFRDGERCQINPDDIVVGDIVMLGAGDGVPADGIIVSGEGTKTDESALTGEPEDCPKDVDGKDPFMLSSSSVKIIESASECRMMAISVGSNSQWGKIRAGLETEPEDTPLQEKLETMAVQIGYLGFAAAILTGAVMLGMGFSHGGSADHVILEAIVISVTIVVVAIPEGLPLAVTISLAYSTRKMYKDQSLIRVLSACETMGNATNICSDKTGTLTENRMTVVQIWTTRYHLENINVKGTGEVASRVKDLVAANCAVNSAANILYKKDGVALARPLVIGSATEGALLLMLDNWLGENAWESLRSKLLDTSRDKVYPFNSAKKRSTVVSFLPDGGVRVYVKGATEWLMADATHFSNEDGAQADLTEDVRSEIDTAIASMADNALRTLCIAHRDFASKDELPEDWMEHPPDGEGLCVDAIVGIIDPLRPDVKDAVATAQRAGVLVRMVTGDNIRTAKAIAKECGILREGGIALEGPDFRKKTPAELDAILPKLQVLARSSPNDKLLLVSRLNGHGLPKDQKSWEERFPDESFKDMKDKLLPGYLPDWALSRGGGGEVVGVTGDGTNDAPALKAADVGLAMGTGTQVAKDAAEITILDDKFSSIVKAISWGRSVYDNIRKFLQFQLSVNIVALTLVFIGVCGGFDAPLNAVMMLWVNLIMDTMGALALGTELPTPELLQRRPYNRDASLVSWPMWRNILCQSLFQLIILNMLLFAGESMFGVEHEGNYCTKYEVVNSGERVTLNDGSIFHCGDWSGRVSDLDEDVDLDDIDRCWNEEECDAHDYTHFTLIFNTFVFCQLFNEFNSRSIHSKWDVFSGVETNPMFMGIIAVTGLFQFILVTFGDELTKTAPLTAAQWGMSIGLGAISLPVGVAMRFIPVEENPDSFFGTEGA